MTRQEAIERFQQMKKILSIPNSDAARTIEAIDMAIEALEQESRRMTNEEIYELFESKYPNFDVNDYRPLSNILTENRQGITVFLINGDIIVYYPLPKSHEEGEE